MNSKLHFFPSPAFFFFFFFFFLLIQRELHFDKLSIKQFSQKQPILGTRDNSLSLGVNFRRRKLMQTSVSSNQVLVYLSMWHGRPYLFYENVAIQVVRCVFNSLIIKDKHEMLS